MTQKILGYIQLVWICDSCGTKNPGAIKSCTSCGAPQPPDVHFEKVDADTFDFIKDEALIRMAQNGPDKHCPYCGTRNPTDAERCVECGSDITMGAKVRQSGDVLEERETPTKIAQPQKLSKGTLIGVILVVLVVCVLGGVFLSKMTRTDQLNATVSATLWQRSVVIEAYQQVSDSDWAASIPPEAEILSCTQEYRYDSDTPQANSTEECGEPYTIDTGTGIGQVVQDCIYRVYEDYCYYETMAWTTIDTLNTSGNDLDPYWPSADLSSTQRFGNRQESYQVYFEADGETFSLTTSELSLYQSAEPGSLWQLEVNQLRNVVSAQPVE